MQTISFLLFRLQPPELAVRIADIRDVPDWICKLRKTYNYRKKYIY